MSLISNAQKNIKAANKKGKAATAAAKSTAKTGQSANVSRKPVKTGGTRGS